MGSMDSGLDSGHNKEQWIAGASCTCSCRVPARNGHQAMTDVQENRISGAGCMQACANRNAFCYQMLKCNKPAEPGLYNRSGSAGLVQRPTAGGDGCKARHHA